MIKKGDVVQISDASEKRDMIVTSVHFDDGRLVAGLAYIGAFSVQDSCIRLERLIFVRKANRAEKFSTAPKWVKW